MYNYLAGLSLEQKDKVFLGYTASERADLEETLAAPTHEEILRFSYAGASPEQRKRDALKLINTMNRAQLFAGRKFVCFGTTPTIQSELAVMIQQDCYMVDDVREKIILCLGYEGHEKVIVARCDKYTRVDINNAGAIPLMTLPDIDVPMARYFYLDLSLTQWTLRLTGILPCTEAKVLALRPKHTVLKSMLEIDVTDRSKEQMVEIERLALLAFEDIRQVADAIFMNYVNHYFSELNKASWREAEVGILMVRNMAIRTFQEVLFAKDDNKPILMLDFGDERM